MKEIITLRDDSCRYTGEVGIDFALKQSLW